MCLLLRQIFSYLEFFKYYGFLLDTVNSFLTTDIPYRVLPLPIGISFYTFQAISYVIDIYRKDAKPQKNILYFALYISMFPQLIAGPIVRYADIEEQLKMRKSHAFVNWGKVRCIFIIGLAKKSDHRKFNGGGVLKKSPRCQPEVYLS